MCIPTVIYIYIYIYIYIAVGICMCEITNMRDERCLFAT